MSKTYLVPVTRTCHKSFEISADNIDDAIQQAYNLAAKSDPMEWCNEEDIIFEDEVIEEVS